jgi:hypothetical protein
LALILLLHFKTVPLAVTPRVVLVRPLSPPSIASTSGGPGKQLAIGAPGRSIRRSPVVRRGVTVRPTTTVSATRSTRAAVSVVAAPAGPVGSVGSGSTTTTTLSSPPSSAPPTIAAPPTVQVITGPVVSIPSGPVQVQVTLNGAHITDVVPVQMPDAFMISQSLSAVAAPVLRAETLIAQNAAIDTVSGATLTSKAYAQSLQAALDMARR